VSFREFALYSTNYPANLPSAQTLGIAAPVASSTAAPASAANAVDLCSRYGLGSPQCSESMISAWVPFYNADPSRYAMLAPLFARLGTPRLPSEATLAEPGERYRRDTVLAGVRDWLSSVQQAAGVRRPAIFRF